MILALRDDADTAIGYDRDKLLVTTALKSSWRALFAQRVRIWDVGLLHSFVDTPRLFLKRGRNATFFRSVFATDVLAHPFIVLSLPALLILGSYIVAQLTGAYGFLSTDAILFLEAMSLEVLKWLAWISQAYVVLWLALVASICYGEWPSLRRMVIMSGFFTLYMATPWFVLWATPVVRTLLNPVEALGQLSYWLAHTLVLVYLWWCAFAAVLLLASSERWSRKLRMLTWAPLMPFYCLCVLVVVRTAGFAWYGINRARGRYRPVRR
jgi:hypothetical protein